jgi:LacI family transcriptional regulator
LKKRETALDVALLAGVSHPTAILTLNKVPGVRINDALRKRIFEAARELRYTLPTADDIESTLCTRSRTIALIERRPAECCFSDANFMRMLSGMHLAAKRYGFEMRSFAFPADGRDLRTGVFLRRISPVGVIFSTPQYGDADVIADLAQELPVVVRGVLPGCSYPSVWVNKYLAANTATDHLLRLGHAQVGALLHQAATRLDIQERLRGYRDSILESDAVFDSQMVAYAGWSPEAGKRSMMALLNTRPGLSAVFASSDVVALGAIEAVRSMGLEIPDDVALVGLGDIPAAAKAEPPLTTVRKPAVAVGWLAMDMLIREISGREIAERQIALLPELIVRQSCGALLEGEILSSAKADVVH